MEIHNVDARVVKRYPSAVAIEWSAELVNKTAKELTTALRFKMYDVDHNLLYSDRGVATVAGQSRSVYRDDTPAVIDHATFARLEKYEVAFQ